MSGLELGTRQVKTRRPFAHGSPVPFALSMWAALGIPESLMCLARAPGDPHGERIRLLQTRWGFRIPAGGREALHPVLLTRLGPMLHSIPSKNPEPVEARYGAQRVKVGALCTWGQEFVLTA